MKRYGLLVLALLLLNDAVIAAGFALKEQGASYLGTAFAGTASAAIDANTSYYNPAGLVLLPNSQATISGTYIGGNIKLYNAFARNNAGQIVTNSSTTARPKGIEIIPGMAFSYRYNSRLAFGLSIGSPFGQSTKYSTEDIARYMATESKLVTLDISPAISYRFNSCWSFGFGFEAMHVRAKIDSAFNAGRAEGFGKNKGDGWTYGYHLGLMYIPVDGVQMGLAYFSRFTPRVSGTFEGQATPPPVPSTLTAQVKMPDRIVYGVTYKYSDAWTAMGEIEWTHWSRLRRLVINYDNGRSSQEDLFYDNSWRFAFGVDYRWTKCLNFKGGFSFEQSPVNNTYRTARLPDSDRYWFTIGTTYRFTKCLTLDAGYAYVLFKDSTINQRGSGADTRKFLSGYYRSFANIVGLQLTWNFL